MTPKGLFTQSEKRLDTVTLQSTSLGWRPIHETGKTRALPTMGNLEILWVFFLLF